MKILCHVGPWCRDQFEVIARAMGEAPEVRFVSGFRVLDQTGLVRAYYANVRGGRGVAAPDDADVIARCRLLRTLDPPTAAAHTAAMRQAIREMLDREAPEAIICESIDQFLHDLLFREARAAGIPAYGLIRSFVNGYFRISERGEHVAVREPDDAEVRSVLAQLVSDDYLPQNLFALKRSPRLTYLRIQLSNLARVVYFEARRWLSGEPYNYHYWSSARAFRIYSAHLVPRLSLGDPDWRERAARSGKPIVYVPLQHYPEATIDYWAQDIEMVDYPAALTRLLTALSGEFHFLIKEHPGVIGFRKPGFYRALERLDFVTICPTSVMSQQCIAASDAVLVWTGSVGFEAALRGKPVLTTCEPYYASGTRFFKIGFDTPSAEIARFIDGGRAVPLTETERVVMVRHLLAGAFAGRFQNDGSFSPDRAADVAAAAALGRALGAWHRAAAGRA